MAAIEAPVIVEYAQFGPPQLSDVDCTYCFDSGRMGGSGYHVGSRCEYCRGPGLGRRLLRAVGLGELLAAPPRELR
jgi:hypothetical protein